MRLETRVFRTKKFGRWHKAETTVAKLEIKRSLKGPKTLFHLKKEKNHFFQHCILCNTYTFNLSTVVWYFESLCR